MSSIFEGVGAIVDQWLGIDDNWSGRPPRYGHKSTFLRLLANPPRNLDGKALVAQVLSQITQNWENAKAHEERLPSQRNWRHCKNLEIQPKNKSAEKILEKRIAGVTGNDWANQIPTASGLLDSGGRHCNIDLVLRRDCDYSLFELKCKSNTPIYAAIEILGYGLVYLFSRLHQVDLAYDAQAKPILRAANVRLRVLAPREYYCIDRGSLHWLKTAISTGVSHVAGVRSKHKLSMDFGLEAFPNNFRYACTDQELLRNINARTEI